MNNMLHLHLLLIACACERLGQQQIAPCTGNGRSKPAVEGSRTLNCSGLRIPTHTSAVATCRILLPPAAHAGAGGARSRAISDRMSAKICRDTATSASWKVT